MADVTIEQEIKVILTMTEPEAIALEKAIAQVDLGKLDFSAQQEACIVSIHQALTRKIGR